MIYSLKHWKFAVKLKMHRRCMSEILLVEKKWLAISTNWHVFVLFNCASSPQAAPAAAVTQTRWRLVERNRTRTSHHPEVFTCQPSFCPITHHKLLFKIHKTLILCDVVLPWIKKYFKNCVHVFFFFNRILFGEWYHLLSLGGTKETHDLDNSHQIIRHKFE